MTVRLLALTAAALLATPLAWRLGGAIETAPMTRAAESPAAPILAAGPNARFLMSIASLRRQYIEK